MEKSKQIWVGGRCYNQYPDGTITIQSSIFFTKSPKPVVCTSEHINQINELNELNNMNNTLTSQAQFISAVKYHNYIVGSVTLGGRLNFAVCPVLHASEASAREECSRLAKLTTGVLYIFVRLEGGELSPITTTQSF